ncbi:hypothetical protein O181_008788 [Austropuccinia psidii MF-1]|uniref:Uncharacterized protein n=1 Tax=Austropuccinia psidii MF-1 TaxID=1389203 RepID=A0A9Q3GIU4_9BASI|nr:hypothetical protein [Austropuccinia psidii MF-1]
MAIFVHKMTSSLPSDHLTCLPCLLLCMNWLQHHPLIISASGQDMLPLPPPHLQNHPHLILSAAYHAYAPTAPSRYDSDATTPSPASPVLMLLQPCLICSAAYHAHTPPAPS